MAEVGFEPPTSRSGFRDSNTRPPRSPCQSGSLGPEVIKQKKFRLNSVEHELLSAQKYQDSLN